MVKGVALITGGAKGIGAEVAKVFAENGYSIVINYLSSEAQATALMHELQSRGVNCGIYRADVSDAESVAGMYKWTRSCFGFVDTVVNNAGICHFGLAGEDSAQDYRKVLDTNFGGAFNVIKEYCRDMISFGRGSIVNISSIWGERGACYESLYSASKSALIGYSKALIKEFAGTGVNVSCILPGYVDTDMNAELSAEERAAALKKMRQKEALTPGCVAQCAYEAATGKHGIIRLMNERRQK